MGALAQRAVLARSGGAGLGAPRRARGRARGPPVAGTPSAVLEVHETFDPPLDRIDVAAFTARGMAERLHQLLQHRGLVCVRLEVEAQTASDEQLLRHWRYLDGAFSPAAMVDRGRLPLEGWWNAAGDPNAHGRAARLAEVRPHVLEALLGWIAAVLGGVHDLDAFARWLRRRFRVEYCFRHDRWSLVEAACDPGAKSEAWRGRGARAVCRRRLAAGLA